jgi:hypothetical protein
MYQFEHVLELLGVQNLYVRAWVVLQACQEFEIFSSETHVTDILLNSHKRIIALHKKCIMVYVMGYLE